MEWKTPPRKEGDPIFRKVPLKNRLIARIFDTAQFFLIRILLGLVLTFVIAVIAPRYLNFAKIISEVIAYGWFLMRDGFSGGASIGKSNQEIIVICTDSFEECTIGRSILRNIVTDVSVFFIFIELFGIIHLAVVYLIVLTVDLWRITKTSDGRRIGDFIAHTRVIYIDDWLNYQQNLKQNEVKNQ